MNIKQGGVCICYKISLPLKIKNIQYLPECINFEIKIKDKVCNFITLYRSPNQCQDDCESFINNIELNLDSVMTNNPFVTVILGDFNAKSRPWFSNDITTYEGSKIDGVTSQFGLEQVIKEPTHVIRWQLLVVYRLNLYNSTKFGYGIWTSFFAPLKLSLPHNV